MNLIINQHKRLIDIQQEFQLLFPLLKIEFYEKESEHQDEVVSKKIIDHQLFISDIQSKPKEGKVILLPELKVKDLEDEFEEKFGLMIQVFRKSGKIWLQTVRTDNWTLAEQQQEAVNMSTHEVAEEPGDYHEQE